jgi:transposase-like protein
MTNCPSCKQTNMLIKDGQNRSGSQCCKCKAFGVRYTPEPRLNGYPDEVRHQALKMYVDGNNLRRGCWYITRACTLSRKAQTTPMPWKQPMRSCAIT